MAKMRLIAVLLAGGMVGCWQNVQALELHKQVLDKDTTWQGTVQIDGDIEVPPGVTLTVLPGTTVKFKRIDEKSDQNLHGVNSPYYPEAEIIILGKLIARGTPEKNIVFTSAEENPKPADWGAINLLGCKGNIIEYCQIRFAYNGVHGHSAGAAISHNEITDNGVGISCKEEDAKGAPWFGKPSEMTITYNRIVNNKGGIGFRKNRGDISHNLIKDNKFFGLFPKNDNQALISYNEITGNKKGIYLYQVKDLKINHNNIYGNTDYDVAVAEAQDYDIDARQNWFGTTDIATINKLIFDKKDDQEMGTVVIEPILTKAVKWE